MKLQQSVSFAMKGEFIYLLDKYIPLISDKEKISYKELFEQRIKNLNQSEFFVPILGIQGTGKSSLINALLFNDIVLPVDADETTCIPVEVKYTSNNSIEINVIFKDNKKIRLNHYKDLDLYVNNTNNPGNEKNVKYVEIQTKHELLLNNVVFVDLPGVGSLTPQNIKTTMDYVEKLSSAVFLLRTVPPITRSEAIFISALWPKLTTVMFVQNRWNDESDNEANDGKDYNLIKLREIAKKHNTNSNIDIKIVNVYKALSGKFKNNKDEIQKSGIQDLYNYLLDIGKKWREILEKDFDNYLRELINSTKIKIEKEKQELNISIDDLQKKFLEEEKEYKNKVANNNNKIRAIKDKIYNYKNELMDLVSKESREQTENLRNNMRRIITSGVVDGVYLSKAFEQNQKNISEDAMENVMLKIEEIQRDLLCDIDELEIKTFDGKFTNIAEFNKKESKKWEKILPSTGSIGGGLGGAFAGAKVGAFVGTSIGGPVGTVVGGIAGFVTGVAIVFIGSWLGGKAKKIVTDQRAKYTLQDLEKPLKEFEKNIRTAMEESITELFEHIENEFDKFKKIQAEQLQNEKNEHITKLEERKNNFDLLKQNLENDYQTILKLEREVNKND